MSPQLVTFLVGPEPFQKFLFLEEIRKELFPKGPTGLNDDSFDLKDSKLSDILDLANTLPMLAQRRLIVIRNADSADEKEQTLWANYLGNPSKSTILVALADKLDKRTKFAKSLGKVVLEFTEPKPAEMLTWIDRLASRHGVKVAAEARKRLSEAGLSLSSLNQEIEKLALFVHPEKVISPQAVDELVLAQQGDNIFVWTDQVVEGKWPPSLMTLDFLLKTGTQPLVLLSMLARHIRILIKAVEATSSGAPRQSLAALLGVPPFVLGRYVEQSRRYSLDRLRSALGVLQSLDKDLKSTGHPPKLLLERMTRSFSS